MSGKNVAERTVEAVVRFEVYQMKSGIEAVKEAKAFLKRMQYRVVTVKAVKNGKRA